MRMDFSMPMNFSNDGKDSRVTVVLTPDDRVPSRDELNEKYGPGNWVIEYKGFKTQTQSSRAFNPENPRRRVW